MRIHLGGSSRQSLVAARAQLDAAVKGASSASASELSAHLFFAAEVFATNTSLRRAFTDASRDASSKSALVKDLFGSKISSSAADLLAAALLHCLKSLNQRDPSPKRSWKRHREMHL